MDRRDSFKIGGIVLSLVVLAGASVIVARVMEAAWVAEGLIYQLIDWIATTGGVSRDVPVAAVVGLVSGWLLMFALDGTKRVQGGLLTLVAIVAVGGVLLQSGRILGALAAYPLLTSGGVALGVVSGAVSASLFGAKLPNQVGVGELLAWIQFQTAANAFRNAVTVFVLLLWADSVVTAGVSPIRAVGGGGLLLLALSMFMRYDYQRHVVTVAPPDPARDQKYVPYVMGGLYDQADPAYHGFAIQNGTQLSEARGAPSKATLLAAFDDTVAFGIASGTYSTTTSGLERLGKALLPRTARIEAHGLVTTGVDVPVMTNQNRLVETLRLALPTLKRQVIGLCPDVLQSQLPERGLTALDRLDRADTILLIGPPVADDDPLPQGVDQFNAICKRYRNDPTTNVQLIITEGEDISSDNSITDPNNGFKMRRRLDVDKDAIDGSDVYPVSRFTEQGLVGFTPVLDRLIG